MGMGRRSRVITLGLLAIGAVVLALVTFAYAQMYIYMPPPYMQPIIGNYNYGYPGFASSVFVPADYATFYYTLTPYGLTTSGGSGTGGSGLIEVTVNDPINAGWSVTWSYPIAGGGNSLKGSTTYTWWLNPPYVPIQISFTAEITQNPTGYTCQIQPSSITNTYGPGSTQTFNITCNVSPITVSVTDSYGAGWSITWSGAASGSQSGSSSTSWTINPTSNGTITFNAQITSTPSGYSSCTITPQTTTVIPGQSVSFTVSCSGGTTSSGGGGGSSSYTVTLYVYAPSGVSWTTYLDEDDAGAIIYIDWWSGTGNGGPYTATVSSGITYLFSVKNLPSGCTASGSPYGIGQTFTPSGSFTEKITISCSSTTSTPPTTTYGCYLTTSATSNPSGIPVSVTPSGTTFLSSGQSTWVKFSAPSSYTSSSSSGGSYWYEFVDWVLSANPISDTNLPYSPYTTASTSPEVYVSCPSSLSSNITISVSGTANYQEDYVTLSGPPSISSSGSYTYTLSWSVAPYSAYEESWSLSTSYTTTTSGYVVVQATVYAVNAGGGTISPGAKWQTSASCSVGTLYLSVSPTQTTTYTSGTSGTVSITASITDYCSTGL